MAERDDDFRFLVQSARRSIDHQRAQHAEFKAARAHRRGHGLVDRVGETLEAIHTHLDVSERRFAASTSDVEQDTVVRTLRLLNGFLGQMQQANTWVQAAANQLVGVGALRLLDETAERLVDSDVDVVTVPSDEYRFATTWDPFSRILRQLGVTTTAANFPVVVFFPSQEARSLLLEPLLVHELGHSTVARQSLVDRVVAHRAGKRKFDRAFNRTATALSASTPMSRSAARILIERHLRRWITEYLCDAIAVLCTGPSYAYSFGAIVSAESLSDLQESHPPTALRIRLILEHLHALGWRDLMVASAPNVNAWLDHLASVTPSPADPHHQFLLDVTVDFMAPLRSEVTAALGGAGYQPMAFQRQQDELRAFLCRRILPAQLLDRSPADRWNIVLAGWLHALADGKSEGSEGDLASSLPKALANWEFGAFLDKSVEMSSVLEAWVRA